MIVGLDHVQVSCPAGSEDALRSFYVGVLGMSELAKPAALAARGGVWFRAGTCEIHCGVEERFRLVVDDLDELAERCAAIGHPAVWSDDIADVRRFHTTDAVGNRLELLRAEVSGCARPSGSAWPPGRPARSRPGSPGERRPRPVWACGCPATTGR